MVKFWFTTFQSTSGDIRNMAVAKSLDEVRVVWRGFNANCANGANFAKTTRKSAPFAFRGIRVNGFPDFATAMMYGITLIAAGIALIYSW